MVISFALCATVAFAQSNKLTATRHSLDQADATKAEKVSTTAGYTGSIFTKDGEIFSCDFSGDNQGYTTGTIGQNEQVNGTNVYAHAQTAPHSMWNRVPDTVASVILQNSFFASLQNYPVTAAPEADDGYGWNFSSILQYAETPTNGWMIMTMDDQILDWGGHNNIGNFNAYIKFGPFSTTSVELVRLRFFQYYRCYYDECWIDYSTDGTTWYGVEINRSDIDVAVNSSYNGFIAQSMPRAIAGQSQVWLRIRYCSDRSRGAVYGYRWFIDDFSVYAAPQSHFKVVSNEYYEGFYQMMPQSLELPVVWASNVANDGAANQYSVTGHIHSFVNGQAATEVAGKNFGTIASDPFAYHDLVIDPLRWYDDTTEYHGWGYDVNGTPTGDPYGVLPTTNTGIHHFYGDITTSTSTHLYGDTATLDTMRYDVNFDATAEHPFGVWARDHGVLTGRTYYAAGLANGGPFWTDNPANTEWNKASYGVFVSYVTGTDIPRDQQGRPWRILGMEMVASAYPNMQEIGAKLNPQLMWDSVSDGSVWFKGVDIGAQTYTVTSNDVLTQTEITNLEYDVYGDYPTIRIMFPNMPEMQPKTAYRVGYQLAEDADFAVATSANRFAREGYWNYFINEEGMKSLGHIVPEYNRFSVMVYDPARTGDSKVSWYGTDAYPMIRLLVGPYYYVPKVAISLECDNEEQGAFYNFDYDIVCGATDSIAVGGSVSYYALPEDGYTIDKIYIDGVEISADDESNVYSLEIVEDPDGGAYGVISLNINSANDNHTLRCTFKEYVGFDPVANNVSMKLQPNPATSMVHVSMKGVSGNVNMALIDMSGRVVTTSQFNAENGTNINVSNLAKGAYFVRITNSKFSKIEKLIVR